ARLPPALSDDSREQDGDGRCKRVVGDEHHGRCEEKAERGMAADETPTQHLATLAESLADDDHEDQQEATDDDPGHDSEPERLARHADLDLLPAIFAKDQEAADDESDDR